MVRKRHLHWLVVVFFVAIIAVVFQQIYTSMTDQGIASGGPYDNAAAYPRLVAVLIGAMLVLQTVLAKFRPQDSEFDNETLNIYELRRPAALLIIFAVYLVLLGQLGYHLTTTPMIVAIMVLCGLRFTAFTIAMALFIAFVSAYLFEAYLKVVLPGGIFSLNIPW